MKIEHIKLGDLALPGGMVDGPFGSDLKASEYVASGVPIIRLQNIKPGLLIQKEIRFVSENKAKELSRHNYQPGDLVIAKLGDPCGVAAVVPKSISPGIIVADVVRFRGDASRVDHSYISYFLNSPAGRRQIDAMAKGTTRQRCNLSDLRSIKINLPPIEEQKRIAAILDKAESLRRKRQEAIELADAFLHAVFVKIARQSSERTSIESLLADVPNAIRTGPFGSQLLVSEFTESGTAVLGIDNVVTNRFTWNERRYISAEKYEQLARYTVFPGDVMITIMGTTGRVAIAPKELPRCISTKHLCTMTVNQEKITPEYLWASLRWDTDVRAQTAREGKGAIMEGWNMGIIKGLKVTRPPIHVQRKFSQALTQTRHITDLLMSSKLQGSALISSLSEIMLNEGNPF